MLKYIALGIDAKEYFNYDGKPLPIRPLSTYEQDLALTNAVEGLPDIIFDTVIKFKLNLIEEEPDVSINSKNYKYFLKYYNEIDYWTVYYSMKNFQDERFSMPDYEREYEKKFDDWSKEKPKGYYVVRQMTCVHEIAKEVLHMTSPPITKLMEFLTTNEGKILASCVYTFRVPLKDEAWKLTPLQTNFLYYSRSDAPTIVKTKEDLPGIKGGTMEDIAKQLQQMGLDA